MIDVAVPSHDKPCVSLFPSRTGASIGAEAQRMLGDVVQSDKLRATRRDLMKCEDQLQLCDTPVLCVPTALGFSFLITEMCSADRLQWQRSWWRADLCVVRQIKKKKKETVQLLLTELQVSAVDDSQQDLLWQIFYHGYKGERPFYVQDSRFVFVTCPVKNRPAHTTMKFLLCTFP